MSDTHFHPSTREIIPLVAGLLLAAALTAVALPAQVGEPAAGGEATGGDPVPPPKDPPPAAARTASGLASLVLATGSGEYHPDPNDQVVAHFVIWTPDGTKVQSSYDLGKPAQFDLQNVFPGWREGLRLMVSGEKRRLWIPAHLAPKMPQGGPEGAVIIDVEVLGILKIPNLRAELSKPPADAQRTPFGAFTTKLRDGEGDRRPTGDESVMANYTGWSPDGRVFSSTVQRGKPTMFILDRVMAAFSDCLQRMVVGEERMCWIPGQVANAQWPGAPQGMLIFEIELLKIFDAGLVEVKKQIPEEKKPPG